MTAIEFNSGQDRKKFIRVIHPDKFQDQLEKAIATTVSAKINDLNDKAKEDGYPFEYIPEKDEYCFLLPKIYEYNGGGNDELKTLLTNNCEDLTKNNFNIEQQILVAEDLNSSPEDKREKILAHYTVLQENKFSFGDQILVLKHLNGFSEDKHEKVLKSHIILNDDKTPNTNSELNDAVHCILGILDEC